eukprot:m.104623 g.104623  ORF g.104623 m.104623 type:complete len:153 (-) comp8892_c0_seq4:11-469(-)
MKEGGEARQRYHCEQDCKFDVCSDCMSAEYSAWNLHKAKFLRGEAIILSGLKYLGCLPIMPNWPDPANHDRYMDIIDAARRSGSVPWRGKDRRAIHIYSTHINITGDHNDAGQEAKVFFRVPAPELSTLTCLDDFPVFLVAMVGSLFGCTVH